MADFTQAKSTLISHQAVTHPESVEGTPVSVAAAIEALIVMWHGFIEAVSNADSGKFRLFGSLDAAGDDKWFHILDFPTFSGTPADENMTATEPVAETVLAVAETTGFTAGNLIYIQDTGTLANSEWHVIDRVVAATSIDIMMGLANAKDSADKIFGSAEQFQYHLRCSGLSRIRLDYSHEGITGANVHIKAEVLVATAIE